MQLPTGSGTKPGKRPSVDTVDPDIVFNLHISNDQVTISLDSSVVPLYKRGYRKEQGPAPMNEILAAGIIKLSGWKAILRFWIRCADREPYPLKLALWHQEFLPERFRQFYGFQRWKDYNEDLLNEGKGRE